MLNPFLHPQSNEKIRQYRSPAEELTAQFQGHSLDTSSPHPSMGLWIGKLLIRMGERLSKQDIPLKSTRESS